MEEDMEVEQVFVAYEIDLDYEFDAARFFDFSRNETPAEAHEAELWFETARSYPPSPFVVKLVRREDILLENVNTSPKTKDLEYTTILSDCKSNVGLDLEFSATAVDDKGEGGRLFTNLQGGILENLSKQPLQLTTGLTFSNKIFSDNIRAKTKSSAKPVLPRSSTLMKPTASQLAKQNQPAQVGGSRIQKLMVQNKERSLCNPSGMESQASKRQKLEGGLLHKVVDAKQQTDFVHKAPKRDGTVDKNSAHARLKLTIPREPDLETANRAQRIRSKSSTEPEHPTTAASRFKARPLNRKILNAPSLPLLKKSTPRLPEFREFHLKTLERAMQHSSAISSSSLPCNDSDKGLEKNCGIPITDNGIRDLRRPSVMDTPIHDGLDFMHNFKACPLNKKIFSSKGEIGVFRNSKQETTVPMAFNFQTAKRVQHNPPVELFSKLSLKSEFQTHNGSELKLPPHTNTSIKGSKENILNSFRPEQEMTHLLKEKISAFGGKHIQCGSDGGTAEASLESSVRRRLGIR
ncbi:Protein TPX2 [Quillaja saponaria]|uniref:Protein TPX2 n=1 Tax=Quillaja saponaria TaxID=32244 RepID=A0AAD7L6P5_QUISA|nr:Protein TPX2 [Quillaja saponaria]